MYKEHKEINPEDKGTYAEMYVERMEDKWAGDKPFRGSLDLATEIINQQRCRVRDAIDIVRIIKRDYAERLIDMGYEFDKGKGFTFRLSDKTLAEMVGERG